MARGLSLRRSYYHGDAPVGTRPDAHFLGGVLLPFRLPGDFYRSIRAGIGRRVFVRGGHVEGAAVYAAGAIERGQQPAGGGGADRPAGAGGQSYQLGPGAGLLHGGAALLHRRRYCLDGDQRDHPAGEPDLLLRPGGRGGGVPAAAAAAQTGGRSGHGDRRGCHVCGRRRDLAQPGRVGERARGERGTGAGAGRLPGVQPQTSRADDTACQRAGDYERTLHAVERPFADRYRTPGRRQQQHRHRCRCCHRDCEIRSCQPHSGQSPRSDAAGSRRCLTPCVRGRRR